MIFAIGLRRKLCRHMQRGLQRNKTGEKSLKLY